MLIRYFHRMTIEYADVAESADALVSGTSGGDIVEVQVLSSAPCSCGRGGIGRRATLRG